MQIFQFLTVNTTFSNIAIGDGKELSDLYLQQAVLVDDNLNSIRKNENLISYTFESFVFYANWIDM